MMHWSDHQLGAVGWLLSILAMVVFWGVLIAVTAAVTRQLMARDQWAQRAPSGPLDPLQLLDERLARGEIDPEDYLRRRELLTGADHDARSETR